MKQESKCLEHIGLPSTTDELLLLCEPIRNAAYFGTGSPICTCSMCMLLGDEVLATLCAIGVMVLGFKGFKVVMVPFSRGGGPVSRGKNSAREL